MFQKPAQALSGADMGGGFDGIGGERIDRCAKIIAPPVERAAACLIAAENRIAPVGPDFEMPLTSEDDNPWGLAVPLAEKDCIFGRFMSGMQYNWLQSGKLIELEATHGIQPTAFLQVQKEKLKDWLEE